MRYAVIVQGLGFGDEGKGATVDFLCRELGAELVVRYCGGSQAGHNVVSPDGCRHVFSQFGAGTLAGAATYLGEQVIINPPAMLREADHLRELTGADAFARLVVHPRALVTTIYHQRMNRLRELSRETKRHGSCGHGIGETRHYWLQYGRDALFAADLHDKETLSGKLELLRQRSLLELQEFILAVPVAQQDVIATFFEPVADTALDLWRVGRRLSLACDVPACRTAIFEGAQGALLDEWRGFHPFTTWSTVTLQHALAMVEASGARTVVTLGLTRSYATRHGAGPFPTWDLDLDARLVDAGNPRNAWQGGIRMGWLDFVLLRYAVEVAGGHIDGFVLNCLDQLADDARVCTAYRLADGTTLERLPTSIGVNLEHQRRLTMLLDGATPVYEPTTAAMLADWLAAEFGPIVLRSTSPTWQGREFGPAQIVSRALLSGAPQNLPQSRQRELEKTKRLVDVC
jgi:adenylosuccinate synthase